MRNFVECCIGGDAPVPDMSITNCVALEPGYVLLACTDGLWSGLSDEDMAEIGREALFSDAFGVVCSADHPLAGAGGPLAWGSLAEWPFIANGLCAHIDDTEFQRVFANSQLMVRNTTSLLALVRAGVGVTVLPRLVVQSAERQLVFLPVADRVARRRIDILSRAHAQLSPAAQSFVDAVRRVAAT